MGFLGLACILLALPVYAQELTAAQLGVIYNQNNASSVRIAHYYATRRGVPSSNLIGVAVPDKPGLSRDELSALRAEVIHRLRPQVQSLLLVWTQPYAVECMSITSAFAAGYQPGLCEPGCGMTTRSPLFDAPSWRPRDASGWLPAMLLPSQDERLAKSIISRGVAADGTAPSGIAYLVRTEDAARNVRARLYADAEARLGERLDIREISMPSSEPVPNAIAYFTGVERVTELQKIKFLAGAVADHLTSLGGITVNSPQMSAMEWLSAGATATYGTVSEPCNHVGKFPIPLIFLEHYLRGDTVLEAYWKSVAMPGQGLFIGEPLAQPFSRRAELGKPRQKQT